MAVKTYMLLDHMRPTAPVSIQVSKDTRIKVDVLPLWRPFLQVTFMDNKDGKNKTIRLKLNSNTPYQDEQIEKEKIPANEAFTNAERDAAKFYNGVCTTANHAVQKYLEVYPGFQGFDGYCNEVPQAVYKLFEPDKVVESDNDDFMRRLAAANKIAKLELKEAQDLLIRVYGVTYVPPDSIKLAQNVLVKYMDENGEEGISEIMREDVNADEEVTILVGRLVSSGVISFDQVPNQVSKKDKGGKWINVKEISSEYPSFDRQRYFIEFLTSEGGKLLKQDLTETLEKVEKQKVLTTKK